MFVFSGSAKYDFALSHANLLNFSVQVIRCIFKIPLPSSQKTCYYCSYNAISEKYLDSGSYRIFVSSFFNLKLVPLEKD